MQHTVGDSHLGCVVADFFRRISNLGYNTLRQSKSRGRETEKGDYLGIMPDKPDNARKICLFALGHWHYAKKCVILCP